MSYFTLRCCRWLVWREPRGNSTSGSSPCPGPLLAGVPPVSASSVLGPWVVSPWHGIAGWTTYGCDLKGCSTSSQECCPSFCFLLSWREEKDLGSGYFGGPRVIGSYKSSAGHQLTRGDILWSSEISDAFTWALITWRVTCGENLLVPSCIQIQFKSHCLYCRSIQSPASDLNFDLI